MDIQAQQHATFGAGCFWGVEERFRQVPGVIETAVGYMGGNLVDPKYETVCDDMTGHAEVVDMTFDPTKVSYENLLDIFWLIHNPTQMNYQGPDVGSQYRSVIFYHSPDQQQIAEQSKELVQARLAQPVVTIITPAMTFWRAEDYHQKYLQKRGLGACHI